MGRPPPAASPWQAESVPGFTTGEETSQGQFPAALAMGKVHHNAAALAMGRVHLESTLERSATMLPCHEPLAASLSASITCHMYYMHAFYYHHYLLDYVLHALSAPHALLHHESAHRPPPPAASPWQTEIVPGSAAAGDVPWAVP